MDKQIKAIIEKMKSDEGTNYHGVNYYRGKFYISSIGAVQKITQKKAIEIIKQSI